MRPAILLTLLLAVATAGQLPVEVRLLWEYHAAWLTPADINGDSSAELLSYDSRHYLVGRDQQLQVASPSRRFSADTRPVGRPLVVGDTTLLVPRLRNDSLFLWSLWHGHALFVCTVPHPQPGDFWDGSVAQARAADIDADGRIELVVVVQAGFAREPRGIYLLDLATGRRRWQFPLGPNPDSVLLHDVDGDGRTELLIGTTAPGNGHVVPGGDDAHTYVLCLDAGGTLRWQREIGRYGQSADIAWFSGRLLVHEQGHPVERAEPDSIFLLDPQTGATEAAARLGRYARDVAVLDGDSLFVAAATDDTVRVYDRRLHLVRRQSLGMAGATGIWRGSFTSPRRCELALTATNGSLLLFDDDLRLLATAPGPVATAAWPVKNAGRHRLLTYSAQNTRAIWRLYEFNPLPFLRRQVSLGVVIAVIAGVLLLFAAALITLRYRLTRDIRAVVRGLTGQAGVVELDLRGKTRRLNPKARELLGGEELPEGPLLQAVKSALTEPAGAPQEMPVALDNGRTVLARAVRVRSGAMLTLEDISAVEYLRRVQSWVPVAQKLAHGIKNPLTAIGLTLQRIEKNCGPDSQRYLESMKDDIDRLRRMTDSFMRFTRLETPRLEPIDINQLVRDCLVKFESARPAGIVVRTEFADNLPRVLLDPAQMKEACSNIIENAVSAVGRTGTLSVVTRAVGADRRVAIIVSDTGPGIPERYLGRIFEPYFTLKPGGTGLGLAITKRIVEDHRGTIRIESNEGAGTTVTIELPVSGTEPA